MAHLDEDLAEHLDAADERRRTERVGLGGDDVEPVARNLHQLGRHQGEEAVAQMADELLGDGTRITPEADRVGDGGQ